MGILGFLKPKKEIKEATPVPSALNSPDSFADSSSIAPDERAFYQPDDYYTYFSYPGSEMAVRVVTFEERKNSSFPTARGLYVAEVMLLEYCKTGKYPKPQNGYPGFWWFKYGIRDVGHALESLEKKGFIKWASKTNALKGLTTDDLKKILEKAGLATTGKKAELIDRITSEIPEDQIDIPDYTPKYELTQLGAQELEENGYIPYMHKHKHLTTEGSLFGEPFNVWEINKLFPNGDTANWRQVVGRIEKKRFGVDMANASIDSEQKGKEKNSDPVVQRDEMRSFLASKQAEISKGIKKPGDGFDEESRGLDYKKVGKDKEALVQFYISIGKKFDAPALYREASILLRKYGMYEEELEVLNSGLRNVSKENTHWEKLNDRRKKLLEIIEKKG